MAERYPGGVISKTPPTVTPPVAGEGGSASGVWTLDTVLEYEKAGAWPKPPIPRKLYAWGSGATGELGHSNTISRSSPVQVGALTNWAQVSAGSNHTACVTTAGTLFTWGYGYNGRLGHGDVISRSSPVQIGALTNWAQVSAGGDHTACVTTAGTLFSWGRNTDGRLGDGTVVNRSSPVQIGALANWAQVSAGNAHIACVKTDGTLWAWGNNDYGRLGHNDIVNRSSPVQVGALTNWAQVAAGREHTACVTTAGTLFTWGDNTPFGQLGDGTTVTKSSPVQVGALTNWSQFSVGAGGYHTACVTTAGTLFTWGRNSYGQLGDGTAISRSSPIQVGALTNWAQVSAGGLHTACVTTAGTLFTWGDNTPFGQLGDGTAVDKSSPVQVGALTTWTQASTGFFHTAAITRG